MSSPLPSEWLFDSSSPSIRVVALEKRDAAALPDAREQAGKLLEKVFERTGHPVAFAKLNADRAFTAPAESAPAGPPSRTVLAFLNDENSETKQERVVAFTGVMFDGERVLISAVAIDEELPEDLQHRVSRAVVAATEELAQRLAAAHVDDVGAHGMMIWRGQLGSSDFHKQLNKEQGYSESLTDRIEMTAFMKHVDVAEPVDTPEGVEIRALDLEKDDLAAVYDVQKMAFGPNPPSYAAWKQHYGQQPRFAADLSFVGWQGDKPVATSFIELIVEGEGGGEDEVEKVYKTHVQLAEDQDQLKVLNASPLQFPADYEEHKEKIRATTKTGYVCGVATVPQARGKGLAQKLLRHNFRAAAIAGLDSIYLGTDRMNPAAVRAYTRAGMTETKSENKGFVTAKIFSPQP